MYQVSTYLNYNGNCEEAFEFYKQVFNAEYEGEIMRMSDAPQAEGYETAEADKNLVMHVCLPILDGFQLMGSDVPASMGKVEAGSTTHINLMIETREESDRIFRELSAGGEVSMPMQDMFWGDYFGSFSDKYGICWMINCSQKK